MTEDRAAPDDLAAAVADGAELDWSVLAARAGTPEDRDRIARFALLARIAGVHAAAAGAADDDGVSGGVFSALPPYAADDITTANLRGAPVVV